MHRDHQPNDGVAHAAQVNSRSHRPVVGGSQTCCELDPLPAPVTPCQTVRLVLIKEPVCSLYTWYATEAVGRFRFGWFCAARASVAPARAGYRSLLAADRLWCKSLEVAPASSA